MRLAILFFILLGLQITAFAFSDVNKVIGRNNLVAVDADATNIPLKYRPLLGGFSSIELVEIYSNGDTNVSIGCTGTHIGNGYVLTAGHCFLSNNQTIENGNCEFYRKDPLVGEMHMKVGSIRWGHREGKEPDSVSQCEKIVFAQKYDSGLDFAIVKVTPVPDVVVQMNLKYPTVPGELITVFSHYQGLPLYWSRRCQVESSEYPGISNEFVRHKCDTEIGSSGASMIDVNNLKIVGIHNGGILDSDQNGVPLKSRTGMNYGTSLLMEPLLKKLLELGFTP